VRQVQPPAYAICPQCGYQKQCSLGYPTEVSYDASWTNAARLLSIAKRLIEMTAKRSTVRPYLLALWKKDSTVGLIT